MHVCKSLTHSESLGALSSVTNPPQNLDPADQNELHRPITGPGCAERTPGRSLSHLSQNARSPRTFRGVKEHSPTFIGLTFFTQPVFPILKLRRRLKLRQKSQFETAEFTAFSSWTFLALQAIPRLRAALGTFAELRELSRSSQIIATFTQLRNSKLRLRRRLRLRRPSQIEALISS